MPESHTVTAKSEKEKRFRLLRNPGILIPGMIGIIAILVTLIFLLNRNERKNTYVKELIGQWEILSQHSNEYVNDAIVKDTLITYDPGYLSIEFKNNLTGFVYQKNSPDGQFYYSIDGNIIKINFPGQAPLYQHFTVKETILTWYVTADEKQDFPNRGDNYKKILYFTARRIK